MVSASRSSDYTVARRPDSRASQHMWVAFWSFIEETHRWQGLYGRQAVWLRPGFYSIGLVLFQLLLGGMLAWFYLFVPLALLSIIWVWCCSMAKRLRNLGHAPLGYVLGSTGLVVTSVFAFMDITPIARMIFWGSTLALLMLLVYIFLAPTKPMTATKKNT